MVVIYYLNKHRELIEMGTSPKSDQLIEKIKTDLFYLNSWRPYVHRFSMLICILFIYPTYYDVKL